MTKQTQINNIRIYKKLSNMGIKFYNPISKYRKYLGVGFLVIAIIPNGLFIPCSLLSCLCFGLSIGELKENMFKLTLPIKYKLRLLK